MKQTKLQRALVAPQSTNANKHKSAELSAGIMKLADECTAKYLFFFRGAVTARSFGSTSVSSGGPWTCPGSYRRVTGKRLFEAADAKKLTNSRVTFRAKAEVAHLSLRAGPCHEYHHTPGHPLKRSEVRRAVRAVIMLLSFDAAYLAAQPERRNHSQYFGEWGRPTCRTLRCSQNRKPKKGYFWSLARLI